MTTTIMPQDIFGEPEPEPPLKPPNRMDPTDVQELRMGFYSKGFGGNKTVLWDREGKKIDECAYSTRLFAVRSVLKEFEEYEGGPSKKILDLFQECEAKFKDSDHFHGTRKSGPEDKTPQYKGLKEIFETQVTQSKQLKVDRVVVLGIGTFCGEVEITEQYANSPYWQLAALEAMLDWLRPLCNIPRDQVFFQDPGLNQLDKDFLTGRGYVVDKPERNFLRNTSTTFLFAPGNFLFSVFFGIAAAYPAIFVGDSLHWDEEWDQFDIRATSNDKAVNCFISKYRKIIDLYRDVNRHLVELPQENYVSEQAILPGVVMWRKFPDEA